MSSYNPSIKQANYSLEEVSLIDILEATTGCECAISRHISHKDGILTRELVLEDELYTSSHLRLATVAGDGGRLVRTESILNVDS